MNIGTLRQWKDRSLANSFALNAALIAVASSLIVALISLIVIFSVEQATLEKSLEEKSKRLAERFEGAITIVESAVADLAKNPMFTTALLDSPGRNSYVVPFLENYKIPINARSGFALCDINGVRLAGMRPPLSECHANSPLFKQVIATGKTARELVPLKDGHLSWTIYQGVLFPYTGTVEGIVVSQIDLNEILQDIPRDLDLDGIALVRTGEKEPLLRLDLERGTESSSSTAGTTLFRNSTDAVPFPIDAVAMKHLSPFRGKLLPLLLGYSLGSLFLVLLVTYWARRVSKQLIAPLSELTSTVRVIAESGNLSVAVPHIETGEVGQLSSAFEVMVGTLQASEAILERKVAQRTEALQESRLAAEAANTAKSRFLATMSHEIRTPMNGILGMAQMLLSPKLEDQARLDYARTVLNSGQTLLTLLNDILDLSKVEAGKIQLELKVFEPAQVIQETKALFDEAAAGKGLRIVAGKFQSEELRYLGDPYRLRQMISNLVGNAIKFTKDGWINIEVQEIERVGQTAILEFSVTDTGIGISEEQRQFLFKPFSQADSSTTRRFGGTGLGLSIVSSLARVMGGKAGVDSEPGRGSRFWFRIQADLVEPGSNSRQMARSKQQGAFNESQLSGRVLIAEDDKTNRKVAEALLNKIGLTAHFAEDGQQALNAITLGDNSDLILMDVHMPIMDGYSATQKIRQWEAANGKPRRPIIALTADAFEEDRQLCLAAGMDDYLAKPISIRMLREVLGKWLPAVTGNSSAETTLPPEKPLDVPRIVELLQQLEPLLEHSKFDAVGCLYELQQALAGTHVAEEIMEAGHLLSEFRFTETLDRVRQIAANNGWKNAS